MHFFTGILLEPVSLPALPMAAGTADDDKTLLGSRSRRRQDPLGEQELAMVNPLGRTRNNAVEGKGATAKLYWGAGESTVDEGVACGMVASSASRSPLGYEDRRYFSLEPPLLSSPCLKSVLLLLCV